jgi:hypothetical protein
MSARKVACVLVSFAIAAQPAYADTTPYFRMTLTDPVGSGGGTSGSVPPSADPNSVIGTGDLAIFAPAYARGRPGVPFRLAAVSSNAKGPVTWSVAEGTLPDGLSLGPDGIIVGLPAAPVTAAVTLKGVDASGARGLSRAIEIAVNPLPVISASSTSVDAGAGISLSPQAQNVFGTSTWSMSGDLPLGIVLDPKTGAITGTSRQVGKGGPVVLSLVDADGAFGESAPFTVEVTSKVSFTNLKGYYPIRKGGSFAGIAPGISGNDNAVTWSLASGTLPAGMSLSSATGAITGVPANTGRQERLALMVTDTVTGETFVSPFFSVHMADAPTLAVMDSYKARTNGGISFKPTATGLLSRGRWFLEGGDAPAGTTFDTDSGSLSGEKDRIGVAHLRGLRIRVVDLFDGAQATSLPFRVDINGPLGFSPRSLPAALVDAPLTVHSPVPYNLVGTATWTAYGLPAGLALDPATGVASGKPTMVGRTFLSYRLVDSFDGATYSNGETPQAFDIVPFVPLSVSGVPALSQAVIGTPFAIRPSARGVHGTASWSVTTIPAWAAFDASTGIISGTPSSLDRTDGIVLTVNDGKTGESASSEPAAVTVRSPVSVSYGADLPAVTGSPFTASPTVVDADGPMQFSIASGKLPEGFSFDASTGKITGTTFDAGTYANLTVSVRDKDTDGASAPFRITVSPSPWTATLPSSTTGVTGAPYALVPTASGFPSTPTWSIVSGSTPSFATFAPATGTISGTPPVAAIHREIRLQADDGQGHVARTPKFDIGIFDQRNLGVSLASTAKAYVNTPFSLKPQATNSDGGETWTVASGDKPAWLALDTATGDLTGTPTQIGTASFALKVTDRNARTATSGTLLVTVAEPPIALGAVPSPLIVPYNEVFVSGGIPVSNALGKPTFSQVSGTLPAGLSLDVGTGGLKGVVNSPGSIGTHPGIVVEATDETAARRQSNPFDVRVVRPVLTTVGLGGTIAGTVGKPMGLSPPGVKGAVGALAFSQSGAPPWLSFDAATGRLSGTPTQAGSYGPVTFTLTDTYDGTAVNAPAYGIQVFDVPVTAAYASIANATYLSRLRVPFAADRPSAMGIGANPTWSIEGTLPAGLSVDPATGIVTGIPTAVGAAAVTFVATDAQGLTARSNQVTFKVLDAPTLAVSGNTVRSGGRISMAAVPGNLAGQPVYTLSGVPGWALFDRGSGTLTGRATEAGTYRNLVLSLVDVDGARASVTFDLTVTPGIAITGLAASYPGRVGKPIATVTPTVSGAKGTVTWSVTEKTQPPLGVSVSRANGAVAGTPQSGGYVSITAEDAFDGATAKGGFSLALAPMLAVPGNLGVETHAGIDAVTPYPGIVGQRGTGVTFELAEGTLPSFARLQSATGTITLRNPTVSNTSGLVLRMTDPVDNATALSDPFSLAVLPEPIVTGMATLYTAQFGKPFAIAAPALRHGIGGITWGMVGSLPPWALQLADGSVTGANPDAFGITRGLMVTGTDATGLSASSAPFDLKVVSAPEITLSTQSIKGRVGVPILVSASTGTTAATPVWSLLADSGALPAGVTFDAAKGTVGGVPGGVGTASFRFHVEDTLGQSSVTSPQVSMQVADAFTLAMSDGAGRSYSTRTNKGFTSGTPVPSGAGGTVTYSITPAVPSGMNAFPADTGILSGLPYASFPRTTFTVTARDSFDQATAATSFSLAALEPVRVSGTADIVLRSGADAALVAAFNPKATNLTDAAAVRWDLDETSGPLPAGVSVNASTGKLVGSASAAARTDFAGVKLRATDADGTTGVSGGPFAVTVMPGLSASVDRPAYDARFGWATTTTKVTLANAVSATPAYALVTKAGTGPVTQPTFNADGSFTLTPDTGMTKTWTYAIRVTDSDGATTETGPVTWTTTSNPQVSVTVPATIHQSHYLVVTPVISNVQGAVTATWTTTPPAAFVPTGTGKLDPLTGRFTILTSGATIGTTYGPYTLNVKDATNQIGSATFSVKVVANAIAIASPTAGQALQWHQSSSETYQAIATSANGPVSWSRIAPNTTTTGSGPGNLTVSQAGVVQLNQSAALGSTSTTIYATDPSGHYAAVGFNASVIGPLASTVSATTGTTTESVAMTAVTGAASLNIGAVTWTLAGAPQGVAVTPSGTNNVNYTVSGTPGAGTGGRTYDMTLTATDTKGGSIAKSISLVVTPPPVLTFASVEPFIQDGIADTTCRDVRLTNGGQGPALGLTFTVTQSTEFATCAPAQAPACSTSLAAGASCWTAVTMKGVSTGTKIGTLNANVTNGPGGTTSLYGETANVVAAGSFSVAQGSGSFTLPRAGLTFRWLASGGGASGSSPSPGTQGGSSGYLIGGTVSSGPESVSFSIGAGGIGQANSPGNPGQATTVTVDGGGARVAKGGTTQAGGSGSGGYGAGTTGYGGGKAGATGSTGGEGTPGTGQGTSFASYVALMKVRGVVSGDGGRGPTSSCNSGCYRAASGGGGGVVIPLAANASEDGPGVTNSQFAGNGSGDFFNTVSGKGGAAYGGTGYGAGGGGATVHYNKFDGLEYTTKGGDGMRGVFYIEWSAQ